MRSEPQASAYRPDARIEAIAAWIGDPVPAAAFPKHELRFRNDRWAHAVGLGDLTHEAWTAHFGRFAPTPDNLHPPLAPGYHCHPLTTSQARQRGGMEKRD